LSVQTWKVDFGALKQLLMFIEEISSVVRLSVIAFVFMWLDRIELVLYRADARHWCQL